MKHIFKLIFVFLLTCIVSVPLVAADFPVNPITVYVPFSAGGTADQLTRLIAKQITQDTNIPVEVKNNDTQMSATDYVNQMKSMPNDGYHLIIGNLGTHTSGTVINQDKILYDPIDDFEPVALLGKTPMYMVLRPDFPANNYKEFTQYYRKNPDKKLTFAHSGYGSTSYLAGIYLASILKLDLEFVPYGGSDPALRDIASGYVDMMIDQTTSALPYIKGGLVKGLFVTSENPSVLTTDIPTSKQVGLTEFDINGWNMVFAPKGTPKSVINILNNIFVRALDNKFVAAELKLSNTVIINEEKNKNTVLSEFLKYELNYWKEISTIINMNHQR